MKFAKASIALLILQLVIVSTVGAKYLYERVRCPRVWTRAAAYDPSLVMRGRYLSLQVTVWLRQYAALGTRRAIPAGYQRRTRREHLQHQCTANRMVPGETRGAGEPIDGGSGSRLRKHDRHANGDGATRHSL